MKKFINLFFFVLIVLATSSNAQQQQNVAAYAKIETNLGTMFFSLSKETPNHTRTFIKNAKRGYFDTYNFNRVIKGFVIQGGETDSAYAEMKKNNQPVSMLAPEFTDQLIHQRGALAAGRDDNKEKESFEGQFYVVDGRKYNDLQLDAIEKRIGADFRFSAIARKIYKEVGGLPHLDQNYTIFGNLVKGFDVLNRIAEVKKDKADKPLSIIAIKVTILSKKEIKALSTTIN